MDKFELLKKYKDLYEQGVLEKDEFDAKKKEILAMPDELSSDESAGFFARAQHLMEKTEKGKAGDAKSEEKPETAVLEPTEEEKETNRKNEVYENALQRKKERKSLAYKTAINELESLGEWRDSIQLIEEMRRELPEIEENEERQRLEEQERKAKRRKSIKKILKITGIGIAIIIAAFIALVIYGNATMIDLNEYSGSKTDAVHDMEYEVPNGWKLINEDDISKTYEKKDDGNTVGVLEITYMGETDLAGDAEYKDAHPMSDTAVDLMSECVGTYEEVKAKHSVFEASIYYEEGVVKGESDFLSDVACGFNTNGYTNPRASIEIDAKYDGSTKAGTKIDSDNSDITVTETFDTGVAEGTKAPDWTVKSPVTLKAGETSTVIIVVGDKEKKLKITCTDMSESQYKAKCKSMNYKNQLREDSYGEYIKIEGSVLQDCGDGYFRISSNGSYDDVYMVLAENSDIVEDDWVTCYGVTSGIYSYETVMGAEQKIPSMIAKYVDR